jgi:ABC-type amino acid transport substrate-binding protein
LRVGINPHFKPFSFIGIDEYGKKGQVGVDIDIAKLLAKELGVITKLVVPEDFKDLIPMLLRDDIDIIIAAMSRIFKRTKKVDFTNSYYNTGTSIMLNTVKCHELGICEAKTYHDLKEKLKLLRNEPKLKIAAAQGKAPHISIKRFFPHVLKENIIAKKENEQAADATAENKAHIMVHDEIFLNTWVSENPEKARFKLFVFPKPYRSDSYGFAIKKGNQSFLNMLNIFISDKLYGENYFEEFMNKWYKKQGS